LLTDGNHKTTQFTLHPIVHKAKAPHKSSSTCFKIYRNIYIYEQTKIQEHTQTSFFREKETSKSHNTNKTTPFLRNMNRRMQDATGDQGFQKETTDMLRNAKRRRRDATGEQGLGTGNQSKSQAQKNPQKWKT
jgi:hypothetical protein